MNTLHLRLTTRDTIISRDGRPFGPGNRMRGLPWLLPSVVAGSFRTALIKAAPDRDFRGNMPERLQKISVAGVFPVTANELYLPRPLDAVFEPSADGSLASAVHRVKPQEFVDGAGCDFPEGLPLRPVMLTREQAAHDFKPAEAPAWWPISGLTRWLCGESIEPDDAYLTHPQTEVRDHVSIDAERGAAAEGLIYRTTGLVLTHMPRYQVNELSVDVGNVSQASRSAEISLAVRAEIADRDLVPEIVNWWHPLGGERRLVHWRSNDGVDLWRCPELVRTSLARTNRIRLVLATPAIYKDGWLPGWLVERTEDGFPCGPPYAGGPVLKLVGVCSDRWQVVSGWSLAPPRGPKPTRRLAPAGTVYFFEVVEGKPGTLADHWLRPVSDEAQDRLDGFGLALWGIW